MNFSLLFYTDLKNRGIWTIAHSYRIFAGCICIVFIASFILPFLDSASLGKISFSFFQVLITLFSISAVFYCEQWVIDPNTQILTFRMGLLFLSKKIYTIPFEHIRAIKITVVNRGKKPYRAAVSVLTDDTGAQDAHHKSEYTIDTCGKSGITRLSDYAQRTAQLIGVPFERA